MTCHWMPRRDSVQLMVNTSKSAVSLFSSGGIADLAVRSCGYEILVSNELLPDRHAVFRSNFPSTFGLTGDIWECVDEIVTESLERLNGTELDLLFATPPCQGMSKNGRGKLLAAVRAGLKPPLDERNRLIVPAIKIARRLRPRLLILENVPEMIDTLIVNEDGECIRILDYIRSELGPDYVGHAEIVEFADYGVAQRRQRLISVFSRDSNVASWLEDFRTLMPPGTHAQGGRDGKKNWRTVRDAIGSLPELDASCRELAESDIEFHRVPLLDAMKYWWVQHTPPGRSAFDNQCIECGYDDNETHKARRNGQGINQASRSTPLYCASCGEMLPRPSVMRNDQRVLMRGYTSAYKRMDYDKPASALTRNLSYACSDNKLHPIQNRVLSLHEAFRLHSIDEFDYRWQRADGRRLSDKTIREIVGESVPPLGLQAILSHLDDILDRCAVHSEPVQGRML